MHIENQSIHCMKKKYKFVSSQKEKYASFSPTKPIDLNERFVLEWPRTSKSCAELGVEKIEQEGSFLFG